LGNKTVASGIILVFLLTSLSLSIFIIQPISAIGVPIQYQTEQSTVGILSPQNKTYINASIPLTFTVDLLVNWIGYSLDGQINITITGNATLPTLPDGWHYLAVYSNDTFGNTYSFPSTRFMVDTIAPTGAIAINGGAASTIDASVMLTLSAQDATSGVAQMRFFDFTWGNWEEYATSKPWAFTVGEGYKTLYVQFRDNAGLVSGPYRATISLGAAAPPSDSTISHGSLAESPTQTPKPTSQPVQKDETEQIPQQESPTETPTTSLSTLTPQPMFDIHFVLTVAGIIIVIAIGGALILMAIKKRPKSH
jgi:hypothetical protein